jgi:tRNA(His) 5'-end guanylyltransferase
VEDEGSVLTNDLSDAEKNIFQGCRIYDKVSPQQINKYFRIRLGSSWKYVHKQTACWMLTDSKQRLSSDRLVRVKSGKK